MVEVFKTNVESEVDAERFIRELEQNFPDCQANFDLSDCDRILRVKPNNGNVNSDSVLALLQELGVKAEIL